MRKLGSFLALFLLASLLAGCNAASSTGDASKEKVELTISAAASLTDAMKEIQSSYEDEHPAVKLHFNFGGSGALQKQIEQGAPVDLFLSAATQNMNALVDQGLIEASQHQIVLKNELVVITSSSGGSQVEVRELQDLTKEEIQLVAIGIPESVPAGSYAREALTHAQLWDKLQPKMIQAKDVRQVLQYVETGNADAGFVYQSDAMTSQNIAIAFSVDTSSYTPVEYPIGILKSTKHMKEAVELYDYLQSEEALEVFKKYGFSAPLPL